MGSLIKGSQLGSSAGNALNWFNIRVYDQQGCSYSQIGGSGSSVYCGLTTGQFDTEARGTGEWDTDYFLPAAFAGTNASRQLLESELTSPFCGYEPCMWATPNLSPTMSALVSGTLGALGSYPPIACRTTFKSVDWNTTALAHLYLRSASCPGYSYGQNLTDTLVGERVTWSYEGGSDVLYLDAKTLGWMFPGLGISINNGSGAVDYTVTGVYPYYGYVTVMNATNNGGVVVPGSVGPLVGTFGTIYSCSSSCTIGQVAVCVDVILKQKRDRSCFRKNQNKIGYERGECAVITHSFLRSIVVITPLLLLWRAGERVEIYWSTRAPPRLRRSNATRSRCAASEVAMAGEEYLCGPAAMAP